MNIGTDITTRSAIANPNGEGLRRTSATRAIWGNISSEPLVPPVGKAVNVGTGSIVTDALIFRCCCSRCRNAPPQVFKLSPRAMMVHRSAGHAPEANPCHLRAELWHPCLLDGVEGHDGAAQFSLCHCFQPSLQCVERSHCAITSTV